VAGTGVDHGRLEAVVLAAGQGARFGGRKLIAPWREGVLLDGALAAAFAAPVRRVSVVWGSDARVPELARAYAAGAGEAERLRLVRAERAAEGVAESLKAGLGGLADDCGGLFVFLGDMPRVPHAIAAQLALALAHGALAAAPVFGGARGHPVLFSAALFRRFATLEGDRGAAGLLGELGGGLALVDAPDDGVLFDVDRPQDLA
jgi:molybdenum cofactor cytidylyltransferase